MVSHLLRHRVANPIVGSRRIASGREGELGYFPLTCRVLNFDEWI
jgi:hypothetical protein